MNSLNWKRLQHISWPYVRNTQQLPSAASMNEQSESLKIWDKGLTYSLSQELIMDEDGKEES